MRTRKLFEAVFNPIQVNRRLVSKMCWFHYKLETEDMTENDHELTTKTFAFVDTIDDLESERKQTGY